MSVKKITRCMIHHVSDRKHEGRQRLSANTEAVKV